MAFECVGIVDTLPSGSALLVETSAFMESVDDQWKMTPKGALVCHFKNPFFPRRDYPKLFHRFS